MQTKFFREPWAFDEQWIRVEAFDDQGRPLGYVFFEPNLTIGATA